MWWFILVVEGSDRVECFLTEGFNTQNSYFEP